MVRALLISLAAALVAAAGACLPEPDDPIEYVRRPEAVIIQKTTAASGPEVAIPDLTLYGDGTLIYRDDQGGASVRLLRSELPDEAVRELLEAVVDDGFLDFRYQQPRPDRATDRPTTHLYAHTLRAANAISAYALDSVLPDDAGAEWDQFRRLAKISERLDQIDPVALGGSAPVEFVPEAVLLRITRMGEPPYEFTPTFLPASKIALAEIVPAGSAPVEYRVAGALAAEIVQWLYIEAVRPEPNPWSVFLQQGDSTYIVTFAPVLPFEENFPEFDTS